MKNQNTEEKTIIFIIHINKFGKKFKGILAAPNVGKIENIVTTFIIVQTKPICSEVNIEGKSQRVLIIPILNPR